MAMVTCDACEKYLLRINKTTKTIFTYVKVKVT